MCILALPSPESTTLTLAPPESPDDALIRLWLHARPEATRKAYSSDIARLRSFCAKPLASVTLADLQAFADMLSGANSSRRRILSGVKSLFRFAARTGYLHFDVAAALRRPKSRDGLADRILSQAQVLRLIDAAETKRNRALLLLLYAGGLRVSEAVGLRWRDLSERSPGGQVTVFGKGSKTRSVLLPASVWHDLVALRYDAADDAPVFPSRCGGGHLSPMQVERIVRAAAVRAGIAKEVTPHFLRHSCASHALDRGAKIHTIQATLGHADLKTTGLYLHARPDDSAGLHLGL